MLCVCIFFIQTMWFNIKWFVLKLFNFKLEYTFLLVNNLLIIYVIMYQHVINYLRWK